MASEDSSLAQERHKDVWRGQPVDNHLWAFYYFCKRQGDSLRVVKHGDGTCDLHLTLLS